MSSLGAEAYQCQQCEECLRGQFQFCFEVSQKPSKAGSKSGGSKNAEVPSVASNPTTEAAKPSASDSTSDSKSNFDVLFLGTGVSNAVPWLQHILAEGNSCEVCQHALTVPGSKNKRNNVSIALIYNSAEDGSKQTVVVDVGKTMRTAMLTEFPKRNIKDVNAILITHAHADATGNLDDVRDFQRAERAEIVHPETGVKIIGCKIVTGKLPIYLHQETMDSISKQYAYLTGKPKYLNEEQCIVERRVAVLDFKVMDYNAEYSIKGLRVRQFPVFHGGDYIALGYNFGRDGEFVYISDVKIIPEATMAYLRSIKKIKILVIDCLDLKEGIFPHMGLTDCLRAIEELKPEKCYLTGMCCDVGFHEEADAIVGEKSSITSLAYDGMYIERLDM
jgi:phosphoribosyl 1,2-cyclic phosphodiesterase